MGRMFDDDYKGTRSPEYTTHRPGGPDIPATSVDAPGDTSPGTEGRSGQLFPDKPLKVHLFLDNSADRKKGKPWMKDIMCRSNSGSKSTTDHNKVTCKRCISRLQLITGKFPDEYQSLNTGTIRELEQELDEANRNSNRLAEALRLALSHLEHGGCAIAVMGTQISVRDVIYGTLALHHTMDKPQ